MDSNHDHAMPDVEESMSGITVQQASRDIRDIREGETANGLVISAVQSHPVVFNGNESSPRNAAPSNINGSLASPHSRVILSSRDSSIFPHEGTDQLSTTSPQRSRQYSEDDSNDDITDSMPRTRPFPIAKLPTGLCYDVRMRYHCELDPPKQRLDFHPEDPRRIYFIYKELCKAGLVEDVLSTQPLVETPLYRIPARNATQSEICLVHDRRHYDFIESTKDMTEDYLVHLERTYDSIYFNKLSFASALLSTGGAIDTCRAVVSRKTKNGIAVIRPPGHHAESSRPMGFCLFDNVSISAKVCQLDYPDTCRKILILDWDVHHGNGIQQAFYQDPNVLYISIHVHEDGNFYPTGPFGDHLHCGSGPGLGKNINIPWPTKGMGDADYLFAFQHVVLPVAYDFNPDLVIIAAGFDAAAGDQLGGCFVSPTCYAHMTSMLMPLASGKLVVCLEGGYNLKSISRSALAVTRTLMGEPPDRLQETAATPSGVATVQKVAQYQSRFWPCLYPKDMNQDLIRSAGAERMHDIVRYYQAAKLYETHKMACLSIFRDRLSKSFEKQVLATPNYYKGVPLLVIFHDPPEIMGTPDPVTKKMELHNTWLADELKHYVDWAVSHGLGVIDVNLPKHLTGIDSVIQDDRPTRAQEIEELAIYLWENYIDCNDATEIFFMGVGLAYHGVMHLLNNREGVYLKTSGIINFVRDESLVAISEHNVYYLSKWYRNSSRVFVANNHLVWALPNPRKPSKRFGTLIQSPAKGLNDMLRSHQNEVQEFILGKLSRRNGSDGGHTGTESPAGMVI